MRSVCGRRYGPKQCTPDSIWRNLRRNAKRAKALKVARNHAAEKVRVEAVAFRNGKSLAAEIHLAFQTPAGTSNCTTGKWYRFSEFKVALVARSVEMQ